jgi:5-methylcytosine-specific restriction endonuclease McrA
LDSTLLLNASFEPIKVISWQRAVTLLYLEKVEVVDEYERLVRSVSVTIRIPAVVRLLRFIKLGRRKPPFTRLNLLARDNFSCQYCAIELTPSTCTVDHVLPRSQGGLTHWHNVVAACHSCNRKKGGRTPEQAKMKLTTPPTEPDWLPVLTFRLKETLPAAWLNFLQIGVS